MNKVPVKKRKIAIDTNPDVTYFFACNVTLSCLFRFISPMSFMRLLSAIPSVYRCRNRHFKRLTSYKFFTRRLTDCFSLLYREVAIGRAIWKAFRYSNAFLCGEIVYRVLHGVCVQKCFVADFHYHFDCLDITPHQSPSRVVVDKRSFPTKFTEKIHVGNIEISSVLKTSLRDSNKYATITLCTINGVGLIFTEMRPAASIMSATENERAVGPTYPYCFGRGILQYKNKCINLMVL